MKRILLIATIVISITSCSRAKQIKEAGLVTDSFLTAYCSGDYDAAAALCAHSLKVRILNASDLTSGLDSTASSAAVSITKDLKWEKSVVETGKGADEVIFTCTTSFKNQLCSYTVTLKPVEKTWLISEIN